VRSDTTGGASGDWARSGVVALTGHRDGPPLVPPGNAATLARRIAARLAAATDGQILVDGPALLAERAALNGYRRRGRVSAGGACRLLSTVDGWAAVSCARPDDQSLLGALVGAALPADPWLRVADWLRTRTGAELAQRAAMLGLAAAPVHPRSEVATPGPGPSRSLPGLPGPGQARSVAGLLVVDFSALWAGPLCAHLVGLAGARVVKVETPQRLDGARLGNPALYRLLHAGHRAVLLDPETPGGRRALSALVDAADIVIEASRPRALARFGLDAEAKVRSGTIWVSITAAGRDSPRVGFGDDVTAGAGLVAHDPHGGPVFCGDALADPLTGLVAAELALCGPDGGGGRLFDVAMSAVVAATLAGEPDSPAPLARRAGTGWVVDTVDGPVPVAEPRHRAVPERAPEPGEHTAEVLRELRIPGC
jgi:crotonobetainyl-CoA:carnitine CoA-transferase CaiB-like acyl-CoA transferase